MLTRTIRINEDTWNTATKTQVGKLRGGFSEYVELLIIDDLRRKRQETIPYEPIGDIGDIEPA